MEITKEIKTTVIEYFKEEDAWVQVIIDHEDPDNTFELTIDGGVTETWLSEESLVIIKKTVDKALQIYRKNQ